MIKISKAQQPKSLVAYKKEKGAKFEDLPTKVKFDLRESLIKEQGYICCYCMKRIPENKLGMNHTKIEHFKCQVKYPKLDLVYSNLHLACSGNEGNSKNNLTCDTAKCDTDVNYFTLSDQRLNNIIFYADDGTIFTTNDNINREIDYIIRLNNQNLKKERASIKLGVKNNLKTLEKRGICNIRSLKNELAFWTSKESGKYKEYFPVAAKYLEKKIKSFN